MARADKSWMIYMIRTNKGSLYTGITTDVERRFDEHQSSGAKAAKSLKGKGPLILEFQQAAGTHSQALKLEYGLKKLTKQKKEKLILTPELLADWFEHIVSET